MASLDVSYPTQTETYETHTGRYSQFLSLIADGRPSSTSGRPQPGRPATGSLGTVADERAAVDQRPPNEAHMERARAKRIRGPSENDSRPLLVRRPAEYRETARRTTWRKTRHDDAGTPDGSKYIKSISLEIITLTDIIINISTIPSGSETRASANSVLASNTDYNTFLIERDGPR